MALHEPAPQASKPLAETLLCFACAIAALLAAAIALQWAMDLLA